MRLVVGDLETSGFSKQDKVLEIALISLEMVGGKLEWSGCFHEFLDPGKDVNEKAVAVHGLTWEKLKGKPKWKDIEKSFLDFVGSDSLLFHNVAYDKRMLSYEIGGRWAEKQKTIDSLAWARAELGLQQNRLCDIVKASGGTWDADQGHGAMYDAAVLSLVVRTHWK